MWWHRKAPPVVDTADQELAEQLKRAAQSRAYLDSLAVKPEVRRGSTNRPAQPSQKAQATPTPPTVTAPATPAAATRSPFVPPEAPRTPNLIFPTHQWGHLDGDQLPPPEETSWGSAVNSGSESLLSANVPLLLNPAMPDELLGDAQGQAAYQQMNRSIERGYVSVTLQTNVNPSAEA